jgi:hypothetical protein
MKTYDYPLTIMRIPGKPEPEGLAQHMHDDFLDGLLRSMCAARRDPEFMKAYRRHQRGQRAEKRRLAEAGGAR